MQESNRMLRDKIADLEDENSRLQQQKQWYKGRLHSIVTAVMVGDPPEEQPTDELSLYEEDEEDEEDEDTTS